ncbi:Uncharacterised protein [Vibrio cholerae]|nr:Uncharacterised protein [Vibrio cholerae]
MWIVGSKNIGETDRQQFHKALNVLNGFGFTLFLCGDDINRFFLFAVIVLV